MPLSPKISMLGICCTGGNKRSVAPAKATTHFSWSKRRFLAATGIVVIVAAACTLCSPFVYADGESKTKKETKGKATQETQSKVEQQKSDPQELTGQQLYAINCNRCHAERYPTEWTAAHWRTVLMHMRVRANLPAEQAKEILKYLEQDAGN
jgi:hypothetical protein